MPSLKRIVPAFASLVFCLGALHPLHAQVDQEQPSNQQEWQQMQKQFHTFSPTSPSQQKANSPSSMPTVETGLPTAKTAHHARVPDSNITFSAPVKSNDLPTADYGNYTPVSSHHRVTYPWKGNIITTVFWIGESGSSLSATTNMASAWITDWCSSYGGDDDMDSRRGFLPRHHAALGNPFYVALPFNDLAFPDKAREWLPAGWARPTRPGQKPVSACKDRWVEIRNSQGRSCFAQWEDVGPLRYDHAEYVFGDERPDTLTRAGLDVSPAVATYLGVDENNRLTAWRFVEAEDVPSGDWLKYEEQATLLLAMRETSSPVIIPSPSLPSGSQPAQQASHANDSSDPNASQKKKARYSYSKG